MKADPLHEENLNHFLEGKTGEAKALFFHFVHEFHSIGAISVHPAKTMIGLSNGNRRIAYVTQVGRNFIHVVFPFTEPYTENFCFQKIARVPGNREQFNHHLRIYAKDDVNGEVKHFMKKAFLEQED